jgi:transcriptional regulator with XRE-family HTH domain
MSGRAERTPASYPKDLDVWQQSEDVPLAWRLNRLFDASYPPGGEPHRNVDVRTALRREGIHLSSPYLSQLRSGIRSNPSSRTLAAIARFFRVQPEYFTNDTYFRQVNEDLVASNTANDPAVRQIVERVIALSPRARDEVSAILDALRDEG